jgi:hypothetical protein
MDPGRLQRQDDASALGEHMGNRVYGLETLRHRDGSFGCKSEGEKVQERRDRRCMAFS